MAVVLTAVISAGLWIVSLADVHVQDGLIGWLLTVAVLMCGASFWTAVILTIYMHRSKSRL